jgi:thioredoxin-like negative regulator of GroEL
MGLLAKLFGAKQPEVWPVHVDDENFVSEVLRSEQPVMLDVWGPGCMPCKKLEPIVIGMARRYQGRVKVAEVNAAEAPRTMERLGVMGTPTVVYFDKGREVERVVGFRGELYHQEVIETELLGGTPAGGPG